MKRPNVAPYDGAGVFTKVGLSRRATAQLSHTRVGSKLRVCANIRCKLMAACMAVAAREREKDALRASSLSRLIGIYINKGIGGFLFYLIY